MSAANLRAAMVSNTYQGVYDLIARTSGRTIDAADNSHPNYSGVLAPGQVWDLIKFMKEEWVDPSELYDLEVSGPSMYVDYTKVPPVVVAPTLTYSNLGKKGDAAAGKALYSGKCRGCHGSTGTFTEIEGMTLGKFVRSKPQEAWFKIKFGRPGTGMLPGLLVTSTKDLQDLYAALSSVTDFPDSR